MRISISLLSVLVILNFLSCQKDDCTCTQETVCKDIDGNVYNTVTICGKVWMAENLKVTKYRNGDPISNVADATQWKALTTGAWCYYNNEPVNDGNYGKLYNGYAVADARHIAPQGWHLPTKAELEELLSCLGADAGGKMKSTLLWKAPNTGATNTSGYNGLPGGVRGSDGGFLNISEYGYWWSSSLYTIDNNLVNTALNYNNAGLDIGHAPKLVGISVRCVKD